MHWKTPFFFFFFFFCVFPVVVIIDAAKRDNDLEIRLLQELTKREGLQACLVLNKVCSFFLLFIFLQRKNMASFLPLPDGLHHPKSESVADIGEVFWLLPNR